ncbi:hypothetical protein N7451_012197 [Penicillium sp. IBT 35674x]|nr:hypothetical protein N7451_012197 [Penicillium sp. IBT 35674x]
MADIAGWCYAPIKVLLESFADDLRANHQPVFKKALLAPTIPKLTESGYKITLFSILPEFCIIDTFKVQMPTEDAIT